MVSLLAQMAGDVAQPTGHEADSQDTGMRDLEITLRKQVAVRLRQTRVLIDENRTRIADRFGVHHTVWQKWEEGRTFPSETVMVLFCNTTGVTMDWIYRGVMSGLPQYLISLLHHLYPEYHKAGIPAERAEDRPHALLAAPEAAPPSLEAAQASPRLLVSYGSDPKPAPKRRRRKARAD